MITVLDVESEGRTLRAFGTLEGNAAIQRVELFSALLVDEPLIISSPSV